MKNDLFDVQQKAMEYHLNVAKKIQELKVIDEKTFHISGEFLHTEATINNILDNAIDFKDESKNFIYMFRMKEHNNKTYELLNSIMKEFKQQNVTVKTAKQLNTNKCKSIYVGSSSTYLRNRLKSHFGYSYIGTYALHLNYWFPTLENELLELKIIQLEKDVSLDILQVAEDFYWELYTPLFGKKGGQ